MISRLPKKCILREGNALNCSLPCLCPSQEDIDFIFKELRHILCHIHGCLVFDSSSYHIAKNMPDALKLYVIASRGFAARLNSIDTNDRLSATRERKSIRHDMTYFCEVDNFALIPARLFYSLTELCRSIDAGEIDASNVRDAPSRGVIDDEKDWTGIKDFLSIQGEQPVNFDRYRDTIGQFLWCYLQREPMTPNISAPASTSTIRRAQRSNDSPASAPTPEPSHARIIAAPTPLRNITHRALLEGYES